MKFDVSLQKTQIWDSIWTPEAPEPVNSSGHSPRLWGHNFHLGGHKQSFGGGQPRYAPPWCQVCTEIEP